MHKNKKKNKTWQPRWQVKGVKTRKSQNEYMVIFSRSFVRLAVSHFNSTFVYKMNITHLLRLSSETRISHHQDVSYVEYKIVICREFLFTTDSIFVRFIISVRFTVRSKWQIGCFVNITHIRLGRQRWKKRKAENEEDRERHIFDTNAAFINNIQFSLSLSSYCSWPHMLVEWFVVI